MILLGGSAIQTLRSNLSKVDYGWSPTIGIYNTRGSTKILKNLFKLLGASILISVGSWISAVLIPIVAWMDGLPLAKDRKKMNQLSLKALSVDEIKAILNL